MNETPKPSVFKKRSQGRYTTELQTGESITVDGPATFRLIEACSQGNRLRSSISVIAEPDVKIMKNWSSVK